MCTFAPDVPPSWAEGKDDDSVAYSLWKVLCVRTPLRVVFAYRRDAGEGAELVGRLTDSLIGGLSITERLAFQPDPAQRAFYSHWSAAMRNAARYFMQR